MGCVREVAAGKRDVTHINPTTTTSLADSDCWPAPVHHQVGNAQCRQLVFDDSLHVIQLQTSVVNLVEKLDGLGDAALIEGTLIIRHGHSCGGLAIAVTLLLLARSFGFLDLGNLLGLLCVVL